MNLVIAVTGQEKSTMEVKEEERRGRVPSVVIMWRMAACHGWLVNGIDARPLSLSASMQRGT